MTKNVNTKKSAAKSAAAPTETAEVLGAPAAVEATVTVEAPEGIDAGVDPWEAWQRVEEEVRAVPDSALVARRIDVRDVFAPTHKLVGIARDAKLLAELSELPTRHFDTGSLDRLTDLSHAAWYLDGAARMQVDGSKRVLAPELVAEANQRLEDGRKLLELFVVKHVPGLAAELELIQAGTSHHGLATAVIQMGKQLKDHRARFVGLSESHFPPKTPEETMAVGKRMLAALVDDKEKDKADWGALRDRCYTLIRNLFFDVTAAIEFVTRKWDEAPELPALRSPKKAGKAQSGAEAADEDTKAKGEDTATADTKPKGEDVKPKGEDVKPKSEAPKPEADAPDDGAPSAANTTDDLPAVGTDG
jgi:hypothetical protein